MLKGECVMRIYLAVFLITTISMIPAVSAHNHTSDTIITVDSTNLRFSPQSVTINESEAIRFFWSGQILPHNAVEENGTFDSGDTDSNEDYRFVFLQGMNGTFEYYCEPHRSLGMVGQIVVNALAPAPNNTTSEVNQTTMPMEEESFLPFLPLQSLIPVVLLAGFLRKGRELNH